jgi:hypothetical protein
MQAQYGDGRREWFGHPTRITVKGEPVGDAIGSGGGAAVERELAAGGHG